MPNFLLSFIANHTYLCFGTVAYAGILSIPFISTNIFPKAAEPQYLFREYEICEDRSETKCEKKEIKSFNDFKLVQTSYKDLLRGTTSYNSGNYVLYFGSEKCPYCNGLLFNDFSADAPTGNKAFAYARGKWHDATVWTQWKQELRPYDIKFVMFSDSVPDLKDKNNNDLSVLPWRSWATDDLISGKVKGEFIRNDKSAIDFRKIRDALMTIYSGKEMQYIPAVIVYKQGQPKIFEKDTFDDLERIWKERKANLSEEQKKNPTPWSSSEPNTLIEFIHRYFTGKTIPAPNLITD